jgi:hypothetical protein
MTASEFRAHLAALDLTPYAAAPRLGISRSLAYRYARGDAPISKPVMLLLAMMTMQKLSDERVRPSIETA